MQMCQMQSHAIAPRDSIPALFGASPVLVIAQPHACSHRIPQEVQAVAVRPIYPICSPRKLPAWFRPLRLKKILGDSQELGTSSRSHDRNGSPFRPDVWIQQDVTVKHR
jgi:hypothetical protein